MLKETKLACRITSAAYDMEIAGLIQAAALDLQIAGVLLGGDVEFETDEDTVVDLCTV